MGKNFAYSVMFSGAGWGSLVLVELAPDTVAKVRWLATMWREACQLGQGEDFCVVLPVRCACLFSDRDKVSWLQVTQQLREANDKTARANIYADSFEQPARVVRDVPVNWVFRASLRVTCGLPGSRSESVVTLLASDPSCTFISHTLSTDAFLALYPLTTQLTDDYRNLPADPANEV